jgi:hypothetical protein
MLVAVVSMMLVECQSPELCSRLFIYVAVNFNGVFLHSSWHITCMDKETTYKRLRNLYQVVTCKYKYKYFTVLQIKSRVYIHTTLDQQPASKKTYSSST